MRTDEEINKLNFINREIGTKVPTVYLSTHKLKTKVESQMKLILQNMDDFDDDENKSVSQKEEKIALQVITSVIWEK